MAVLDDPPPTYSKTALAAPSPRTPTLLGLPDHLLLQILSYLPLPALSLSVRSVNRQLHLFASHILRRALLPVWTSKIRPGNTSDPLRTRAQGRSPSANRGRELAVLDLFVSACVTEAVRANESELFLLPSASASTERDIFELLQPRARVEDLVILYGVEDRVVLAEDAPPVEKDGDGMVRAQDLAVTLTGRSAKLSLPFPSANQKGVVVPKTVVEVGRREGECLEKVAEALLDRLTQVPLRRFEGDKGWWYVKV